MTSAMLTTLHVACDPESFLTVSSCQMASDEDEEVEAMFAPVVEEIGEEDTADEEAASEEAAAAAAAPVRSTGSLDDAPVDWDGSMSVAEQNTRGFFMYSNAGQGSIFAKYSKRLSIKHPKRAEGERAAVQLFLSTPA